MDIVELITSPDVTLFDNILNSFVAIAAVQIGLTDVLRAVGLVPDHIIGKGPILFSFLIWLFVYTHPYWNYS